MVRYVAFANVSSVGVIVYGSPFCVLCFFFFFSFRGHSVVCLLMIVCSIDRKLVWFTDDGIFGGGCMICI